jgi:hypothetical protein
MTTRERLRKKLAKKAQPIDDSSRRDELKQMASQTLHENHCVGAFDEFKYSNFSKDTYIEFCKMSIDVGNIVTFNDQHTIDGYAGLLDKYSDMNEMVKDNKWLIYDNMLGPMKYLFDNRTSGYF